MNGPGRQLLARPAFAPNQNCGIARGDFFDELIDLAHAGALAHHVVLQTDFSAQSLVFAAKSLELACILDGDASESGDGGEKLQIVGRKCSIGVDGIEINDSEHAISHPQWNTE